MKRFKLVAFISTLLFFSSCTSSDFLNDSLSEKHEKFKQELISFYTRQHALLDNVNSRSGGSLSEHDIEEMGQRLDDNTTQFFLENDEYLSHYAPELMLTEDEFDSLLVNEESMLSYLEEAISPEVYDCVVNFVDGDLNVNIDSLAYHSNLNPLEMAEIVSLSSYSDFRNYLIEKIHDIDDEDIPCTDDPNTGVRLTLQQELENCETDYMEDFRDCGLYAIGSMFSSIFAGQGALIVGAFSYGTCQYSAYKTFKRCKRNALLRY